jgi:hypothetical protein
MGRRVGRGQEAVGGGQVRCLAIWGKRLASISFKVTWRRWRNEHWCRGEIGMAGEKKWDVCVWRERKVRPKCMVM